MLWLLITGKLPTSGQVGNLTAELHKRSAIPERVRAMLQGMGAGVHPMTQLSMAVLALQPASKFAKAYQAGAPHLQCRNHMNTCDHGSELTDASSDCLR